jgi:hypothetical protein
MNQLPVHIDAAKRELQAARRVIDAKTIHDKAKAVEQFAKAANDDTLLAHAREIKIRAKRRAGELIAEMRESGKLAKQGRKPRSARGLKTIAETGVTQQFANEAQQLAAADEDSFEHAIAKAKATDRVTEGFVEKIAAQRTAAKKARRNPDDDPLVRALTRWPLLDSRSLSPDDVLTLAGALDSMDSRLAKIVIAEAPRIQTPTPRWDLITRAAKLPKKLVAEVIERYESGDQFEQQVALNLALHQPPAPRREDLAVGDLLVEAQAIAARIKGGWRKDLIADVVGAIEAYSRRAGAEHRQLREQQLAKLREEAA